jgi:hypothetical protein
MTPSPAMFPQLATIVDPTAADEYVAGERIPGDPVAILTLHPAQLAEPPRGQSNEIDRGDGATVRIDRFLYLEGYHPEVTETMRASCDGFTFDIEAVTSDSHHTYTRLDVRFVR